MAAALLLTACTSPAPLPSPSPALAPTGSTSPSAVVPTTSRTIAAASPSATARYCPKLSYLYLPAGFAFSEQVPIESGDEWIGVTDVFRDSAGRAITLGSGVPGEIGGRATGEKVRIRGFQASITKGSDTFTALWFEAPLEAPCYQYSVTTVGLPVDEFRKIIAGIR